MSKPLENKIALVTGSSRVIGAAIAIRLAAEGASVIVNYSVSPARADAVVAQIKKAGGKAETAKAKADLGSLEGPKTSMAAVDKAFGGKFGGRLDVLVNNAGTVERGPFLDSSDQSYDKHFNLNVRSLTELSKDSAKRMVKTGWGRIINIGSAFGEAALLSGVTIYVATKFAVHGFTRGLSRELDPTGVTVNGIQPGPTNTELSPEDGPASDLMKKRTSVAVTVRWRRSPLPQLSSPIPIPHSLTAKPYG
jgi:3-oxoacyl-[acyl-carrier protein] reductase